MINQLNWSSHFDAKATKASRTLQFLQCNMKRCTMKTKGKACLTLVRPITENVAAIWDPHQQKCIDCIVMVQRRAAHFVQHNYQSQATITAMLQNLQWSTLKNRRLNNRLAMLYNCTDKNCQCLAMSKIN